MGIWEQPTKNPLTPVEQAIEQAFPGFARSCTFDENQKLIFLEMPDLSDDDIAKLVSTLQVGLPTAFVPDPTALATAAAVKV